MVAGQLRRYVVLNVLTAADRAALLLTDSWKKMARLINPTKLRVDKVEIQHTNPSTVMILFMDVSMFLKH